MENKAATIVAQDKSHALLSPSSAEKFLTCIGAIALEEGTKNESSEYADEGTAAHELAATCLTTGEKARDHLGRKIEVNGRVFVVDEDFADAVQVYLDYVNSLVEATGGSLLVEVQVPIGHITGEDGATGTSDTIILTDDEIIVVDLKFGRGEEVSAIENKQMQLYALGALELYGMLGDYKNVRMAISQPRITHAPSEWSEPIEQLVEFGLQVSDRCTQVIDVINGLAEPVYTVSEKGCRWCRAKVKCPELQKFVEETVGADFEDLTAVPSAEGMTPERLGMIASRVDIIEQFCSAVRGEVERELLQGTPVPGWKLVQGRKGNRAWIDAAAAEEMMKSMRLKEKEMYDFKLISPTSAEKLLKGSVRRWNRIQTLIGQSDGKIGVAPATDPRPEVKVSQPSVDDFENLC